MFVNRALLPCHHQTSISHVLLQAALCSPAESIPADLQSLVQRSTDAATQDPALVFALSRLEPE